MGLIEVSRLACTQSSDLVKATAMPAPSLNHVPEETGVTLSAANVWRSPVTGLTTKHRRSGKSLLRVKRAVHPGHVQLPLKFWSQPVMVRPQCDWIRMSRVHCAWTHGVSRVNKTYNQKTLQQSEKRFVSQKWWVGPAAKLVSHTGAYRFLYLMQPKLCKKKLAAGSQPKNTRGHTQTSDRPFYGWR